VKRAMSARLLVLSIAAGLALGVSACTEPEDAPPESIDTRLETHVPLDGEPTVVGLAYVQAIASAHQQADEDSGNALTILLAAVERTPPAGDGPAERLHYELLARTGELLLAQGKDIQALKLLAPRLDPETSLPVDRATARCLVALGDAAARGGDHAQAMGSYARALEVLTLLLEEVES
jgi:tetratricopeptide (TPR) repeat protein